MFFKQVWRNAAKNRKGNGLFFGSLVIAIVAFYTLLSLGEQDVIRFLSTIESDAVAKLLRLLPIVYAISLFFMFFLVYFACKYQTDSRRKELGMYLMLGMKRGRMFFMLFCETLWSSLISLLFGIPVALFLTEGISLATARIVGLDIIGHRFAVSFEAIIWTVCGFIAVQMLSMLIICIGLGKTEPADFLRSGAAKKQRVISTAKSTVCFVIGAILLLAAYYLGIFRMKSLNPLIMLCVIVFGISGTFLVYKGMGGFLGRRIRRKSSEAVGLETFTARQVQEMLSQHKALSVASLLLLMALACISYGISVGIGRSGDSRSADFSLFGDEMEIENVLKQDNIREMVKDSYPLYLSRVNDGCFDTARMIEAISSIEGSNNIVEYFHIEYVIAESSYNRMLKNMGKNEINLKNHEAAVYTSMAREGDFGTILQKAIKKGVSIGIDGTDYELRSTLYYDNVVADRAITLYMALIVPDEIYAGIAKDMEPYCRNVHLTDSSVKKAGLMQAVKNMDEKLAATGIEYDSFLGGIGRNLFYTVSASYLTIYLGVLFLLIANTVIGMKYLIGQRRTKHRYETLYMLGADTETMCGSVKKQIYIYFALILAVAAVSSAAAVITMFNGFTKLPVGTSIGTVAALAACALMFFILTEIVYISVVRRTAGREVRMLEIMDVR